MKRSGPQTCDACSREFVVRQAHSPDGREGFDLELDWRCPHCGHDNKPGTDLLGYAARCRNRGRAGRCGTP